MFAKSSKVAERRIKRRLKAAASIFVAIAAGAFITCKRGIDKAKEAIVPDPSSSSDAGSDVASNATTTAIVVHDAATQPNDAPSFDANEHKKGMPVPDNLLE